MKVKVFIGSVVNTVVQKSIILTRMWILKYCQELTINLSERGKLQNSFVSHTIITSKPDTLE